MKYTEAQINDLIEGIYDGTITEYNIPESLYYAIADHLKKALYEGFGTPAKVSVNVPDFVLLRELHDNIYMFSAAKSYTELKDMRSLLSVDDRTATFTEFKKAAMQRYEIYNVDYLKAEYNTALASGDMAMKWMDIERNKEILPLPQYQTVGGDVCDICKPIDGVTLPVSDPFWKERYPPNHFNCMCIVTQHESDELPITKDVPEVNPKQANEFRMNVGVDKYVFSPEHPYFEVARKDKDFAASNFGLPIPELTA